MRKPDNIGISGVDSIRIGDMKIGELPIAETALARQQLPEAINTERENQIRDIIASSPTQSVAYLDSRIRECQENIVRIGQMKLEQQTLISEYTSQISLCEFRDKEIARIPEDDWNRDEQIKDLKKRFPPYNVEAMRQQIVQSQEAIERGDGVIAAEYESIAELRELLTLCQQRDNKLRGLGVTIPVG